MTVDAASGRSTAMRVEKDVGQICLVDAKGGKILRTSRIPDFQPMNGRQEAGLLRSRR